MPSRYSSPIKLKIIKSVGKLFLNSSIHPYAHSLLNLIQYAQVLAILLGLDMIQSLRQQIKENQSLQGVILMLVVFQGISVIMTGIMAIFQKGYEHQNVYTLQHQSHLIKVIQKSVSIMLLVYRKILALPIFTLSYTILHGTYQTGNIASSLAIINIIFTVGILHPLSGIIFNNKITFYPNIIAYPYKVNIESLLYIYMPICIFLGIFQSSIVSYINLMFSAFCFAIMYIRPIVMYRQNKIALAGNSSVLSSIFLKGFYAVLSMELNTGANIFLFVTISIIFAIILYLYQVKRIKTILLTEEQNNLFSKITRCNFNQILFYHIVNYETESSSLLLFLIAYNQKNIEKKANQRSNHGSDKNITAKKQFFVGEKQCQKNVRKIIEELKTKNMQSKQLQQLFSEFLLNFFKSSYNPDNFLDENLGVKQLNDKINYFQGLSIIISQILMLQSSNLRKCYTFMRLHQRLLKRVDYLGLIESIEIYSSIAIIEEDLKVKGKTSDSYSIKAEKYFVFEQVYESLKNTIFESCDNRVAFWQEHHQKQIHCQRLKSMIHKNFALSKKIEMICSNIIKEFPKKSPIILFDLIASYSTQILNKKIYSTLSPFYSLVKKYKEELQFQKRQGALMVDNTSIKNFSLLQNIGVCMIDLQHNPGKIEWGNQYFWLEFYLGFVNNKNNKESQMTAVHDDFIFNLMLPQLKDRHLTFFKNFSSSSTLNQDHQVAFLYEKFSKVFQRVHIEIQIFPSLSKGLKVTTFMVKFNLWDQDNFQKSAVLIDQDFSILGFSKEFICLKNALTQNQTNSLQLKNGDISYLCQELIELQNFTRLMQANSCSTKERNTIEVKIGHQTYLISLVKIYKNSEEKDRTIMEQVVNKMSDKKCGKKIYLLEITPIEGRKKQQTEKDGQNIQKLTNFLANTLSQQVRHYELKSQNSIYTSYNSCNIDRTISLVPDVQKQEQKQNENKGSKNDDMLNMQKKYKGLMFSKKSKKIRYWIYFTFLIIILLGSAMAANIFIFNSRQELFEDGKSKIKYFYQIMTDIGSIIIALREYNYYVYMKGPTDPHIQFLIDKIASEQSQVNFKLKQVAKQMGQRWPAIVIKDDAKHHLVDEQDFIVIANYMLSGMTFISQIQPQEMNFPIFLSKINPSSTTSAILNFNQAIYNGIYVVLDKMAAKRPAILAQVLNFFNQTQQKYYLYSCLAGIVFLFVFSIISIFIERKSQAIRLTTVELLAKVNASLKEKKVQKILEFKQRNGFVETQPKKNNKRKSAVSHMAKTFSSLLVSNNQNSDFMNLLTKGRDSQLKAIKNKTDEIKFIEPEFENDTKRDLFGSTNNDLEPTETESQVQNKNIKKVHQFNIDQEPSKNINLPLQNAQRFKILFYALVITPTLIYFILTMIRGAKIDSNMISNYELASQIYIRKSNQQLALLMTRETFYFEPFLTYNYSWTQNIIPGIEQSLRHYRKLQKLIYQNSNANTLRVLVEELKSGNLCNQLQKLPKSEYEEVKFTQEECDLFQEGILRKGLKQTETWYYSTAMFILSNITDASVLTYEDRVRYLQMPEFTSMKIMLAYAQQFSDMIAEAFEVDFEDYSKKFINQNLIYSTLSIFGLGLLLLAIKYRWRFVSKQRKEIISILDIVSLESIKSNPSLARLFDDMELNFYK